MPARSGFDAACAANCLEPRSDAAYVRISKQQTAASVLRKLHRLGLVRLLLAARAASGRPSESFFSVIAVASFDVWPRVEENGCNELQGIVFLPRDFTVRIGEKQGL